MEISVKNSLIELNRTFHAGDLIGDEFYRQLKSLGVSLQYALLISIYPDSNNTWCGELIENGTARYEFDIDLNEYENSDLVQVVVNDDKQSSKASAKRVLELEVYGEVIN